MIVVSHEAFERMSDDFGLATHDDLHGLWNREPRYEAVDDHFVNILESERVKAANKWVKLNESRDAVYLRRARESFARWEEAAAALKYVVPPLSNLLSSFHLGTNERDRKFLK